MGGGARSANACTAYSAGFRRTPHVLLALLCRSTKEWYNVPLANAPKTTLLGSLGALPAALWHPGCHHAVNMTTSGGVTVGALSWVALLAASGATGVVLRHRRRRLRHVVK